MKLKPGSDQLLCYQARERIGTARGPHMGRNNRFWALHSVDNNWQNWWRDDSCARLLQLWSDAKSNRWMF